jgi:hypothetical protein
MVRIDFRENKRFEDSFAYNNALVEGVKKSPSLKKLKVTATDEAQIGLYESLSQKSMVKVYLNKRLLNP